MSLSMSLLAMMVFSPPVNGGLDNVEGNRYKVEKSFGCNQAHIHFQKDRIDIYSGDEIADVATIEFLNEDQAKAVPITFEYVSMGQSHMPDGYMISVFHKPIDTDGEKAIKWTTFKSDIGPFDLSQPLTLDAAYKTGTLYPCI